MKFAEGGSYSGNWINGKFHGNGTRIYKNAVYEGEFRNGIENGQGSLVLIDGTRITGTFVNGQRTGKIHQVLPDGRTFVGQAKNNNWVYGTFTYKSGNTFTGPFIPSKENKELQLKHGEE